MDYRVEQKYLISDNQIAYIKTALSSVISPDPNMKGDCYLIRSVYFDDCFDTCLWENESGYDHREKFRIRTYNGSDERIRLELKSKTNGFTGKKSTALTKVEAEKLLNLEPVFGGDEEFAYLKDKLGVQMLIRRMQPVCMVEYERTAYIDPLGNVRITFDRNIGCSDNPMDLWSDYPEVVPVLPAGQHILEVKYDEFLPDYIRRVIDTGNLQKTAFSKYYFGRVKNML